MTGKEFSIEQPTDMRRFISMLRTVLVNKCNAHGPIVRSDDKKSSALDTRSVSVICNNGFPSTLYDKLIEHEAYMPRKKYASLTVERWKNLIKEL